MPELPEVESARCLVEAHCIGAKVLKVEFNEDGTFDEKIFTGTTEKDFRRALVGKTLVASKRRGKHAWWELSGSKVRSDDASPLFHFGMTGAMSIKGKGAMKYKAFVVDETSWPPRFAKLVVTFSNGISLAYTDPRRFGRIRLVRGGDVESSPPISDLGFDPLLEMPDEASFAAHFVKRAAPIKSVLLDQKIAAGVGNWIADEVLYQAAIHPEQPSNSLSHERLCRMRDAMAMVIGLACEAGADAERFPQDWLFHNRWGKVGGSKVGGKAISFITVGGRTTAFVPGVQKKTSVRKATTTTTTTKKTSVRKATTTTTTTTAAAGGEGARKRRGTATASRPDPGDEPGDARKKKKKISQKKK